MSGCAAAAEAPFIRTGCFLRFFFGRPPRLWIPSLHRPSSSCPSSLSLYVMFPPTNSWELICLYITLHYPRRLRLTALSKQSRDGERGSSQTSPGQNGGSARFTDTGPGLKNQIGRLGSETHSWSKKKNIET